MITDVFTKNTSSFEYVDLCAGVEVCEQVRTIYNKYKGRCEPFLSSVSTADNTVRKHYVYAWYAKTEPKRYFYVGKGTAYRYNHILQKIKDHREGGRNSRFKRFSDIQDKWGIDHDIIINGLTDYEALIYEQCLKLEFIDNGEVLLNVEGIPYTSLSGDWENTQSDAVAPQLIKDAYYQRYFDDYNTPYFDKVSADGLMNTHIYPYFVDLCDLTVISDKEFIISHLQSMNAKLYKTVSKKPVSVIVQGALMYDRYLEYRQNGKLVYSSKDVIEFLKKSCP